VAVAGTAKDSIDRCHGTRFGAAGKVRLRQNGASAFDTRHLLTPELLTGLAYLVVGIALLRLFEYEGRRTASLDTF